MCHPDQRFLTRKEMASALEVHVRTLARNEQGFGLSAARCDLPSGRIRYDKVIAEHQLREHGLFLGETGL